MGERRGWWRKNVGRKARVGAGGGRRGGGGGGVRRDSAPATPLSYTHPQPPPPHTHTATPARPQLGSACNLGDGGVEHVGPLQELRLRLGAAGPR